MLSTFNSLKRIQIYKKEMKYLSRCKDCCHEEKFDCICHKKPRKHCNCPSEKCKCDQKLLKDCVCVEWSVLSGRTQTVFQTGGFKRIFASGFVSFDCGSSDSVIVRFYLGSNQVGPSIRVFEESSVAFSYTRFDRITVECPTTNMVPLEACEGEICIKTRTPVF
jgi:hypothetical protein